MEMTGKTLRSRLISLLLAICIAVGFVPLIDYSAFAVDNETTIGELVDGTPRSGNGWNWDGSTLTLFGTELKSKDDSTPKISYSGDTLTINVKGYNRVSGDSLLAKVGAWKKIDITGSGILESDSASALFNGFEVIVDGAFIKAPNAKLFDDAARVNLTHNSGYLEIGTLNATVTMAGGVINCATLSSGSITQDGGVFYVDTLSAGKPINCNKGAIFKVNTITDGADYSITCNNGSIVMIGENNTDPKVTSDNTAVNVNGLNVYCNEVADASVSAIPDGTDVNGVYYANESVVSIGNNVTFDGAAYFAGDASLGWNDNSFTVAEGATVAGGGSINMGERGSVIISASSTMCFDEDLYLYKATVDGSVYGGLTNKGKIEFIDSTILSPGGRVYSLGYCWFQNSNINGSVTVYGTSINNAIYLDGTNVNGKIYLYDSNSHGRKELMKILGWTFNGNAELACYMADCGELSSNSVKFDMAIGSKAFYSAADLGGEFMATVSTNKYSCGKVIYIGEEFEERFDTAFSYSSAIYDGRYYTNKSLLLSLDPAGDKKAFLAYNSTRDIDDLDDVAVTITKGSEDCTSCFDIKRSHYYYTDDDGDGVPDETIARSIGIEIGAKEKLTAGDEYKVTVEYNGTAITETIEVTGVETTLNFTGEYNYAPDVWTYDGVTFENTSTDYEANTWAWYANENTALGYPAKTLVLKGIDLASSRYNAVIVPNGTTIILKGENKLFSSASAILCTNGSDANDNGSLTIKGEDGGSLTAISSELAPSAAHVANYDAVIMIDGYAYENQTLLIKDATLNITAKKAAEVGSSNKGCVNCYGISSDYVIIENSDITAYAGPAGQDNLESAAIRARDNIIIRGNSKLDLTSEQYALRAGSSIKSVQLNRLEGADVSLDDFNSSLKNNSNVYNSAVSGTSVYLSTKPVEQLKEVKTAEVLDPEDGKQIISLSDYFSGGTGSYVFALADGVTLPSWITLAQNGTLTLDTPDIEYPGGEYKLTIADDDSDLSTDPLEFTITVGKIGHTVKLTVDHDSTLGTVTPNTGRVLAGEDTVIEAKANDGMYIESVTLDGTPVELTATGKTSVGRITSGTYTIEKINKDHTVNVKFKAIPTYKVTVTANNGGTVTVETAALAGKPDYTYDEGTDVVISALAADGYRIKSVTLDGAAVTLTDGKYMIKGITANCTFAVEFEEIPTYTVTITANNGGTVTAETAALASKPDYTYNEGTDVVISAIAADGYRIRAVTLGGAAVTLTDGKYTIKGITANCVFSVEFEEIPKVQLTVKTNGNGTVTVDTAALQGLSDYTFYEGTEVSVTITPNAGYTIKSVKLGDESVSVNKGKCVFSISGDCTLNVEFKKRASGGSSGRRNDTDAEQKPILNGSEKSWTEIADELDKMPAGGSVTISLNDVTTIPAEVIRSIMNKKLKAEFIVDSTMSWIIDGEKVTSASEADLRVINSTSDTGKLHGVCTIDVKVNKSDVPAALRLKLNKEHTGKFANIYRTSHGKLEYFCSAKIGADGIVDIIGAEAGGEYVAMVYQLSCKPGDANNDGILNALDASAILKYAVGLGDIDNPEMADMNGDSAINAIDAYEILKAIINA